MPPTPAATALKGRTPPQTAPATRATRSRAAKGVSTPVGTGKPSGFLARGKEGLRKVSDKIKEKEKEKAAPKVQGIAQLPDVQSTESLKAYLRIRPPPDVGNEARQRPYLELQNDREVLMRAPMDPSRPSIPKAPLIFSFDRVFPPSSPQSNFFSKTTLPLVEKLLHGENGLLFAYGVTNSGKSYTISGGQGVSVEEKGLLPRSVDVVFNSIEGMESKANLRCVGTGDVEFVDEPEPPIHAFNFPISTTESIKVDRNYSYAVFVSYAEVYNDKIFDLLDSVLPQNLTQSVRRQTGLPRASSQAQSSMNLAAIANGGAGVLKRRVLQLKPDPEGTGKYISGLNEVRVRTREEAMSVFSSGQSARQVFSTLSNRESSRSHGIFTIKVVRIHNGAPGDVDSAQVSRLAIVDLAGSERNKNTGTSGDRLKEAGNINKSLMVLGQCLETLRSNQQKLAAGGKKLTMVPYRHSKLTEIFQNFFVGDGRAVMIVNVNPYDTGYDENSHVMRFSAVAREVQTTASNKVTFPGLKRHISSQFSAIKHAVSGSGPPKVKVTVPVLPKQEVGGSRESEGFVMVEEELEVVEEAESEEDEDDGRDVLVDALFDQLREMKTRLYEAEMRNATLEAELRDELVTEMQGTITKIQAEHNRRMQEMMEASEIRADRKIDLVTRMTPGPSRFLRAETGTPMSTISSEADTTGQDDTFASALDVSHVPSSSASPSVRQGRVSDPFVVRSPIPALKVTRASSTQRDGGRDSRAEVDDELALESEGETETDVDVSQDLGSALGDETSPIKTALPGRPATSAVLSLNPLRQTRAQTAESDDILAAPFDPDAPSDSVHSDDDDLSDEDEEDEDDEEAEEEELDTGDQADQDSSFASSIELRAQDESSESDFNDSDAGTSSEEEEERPIRRASRARRTTGSPRKRSPVKKAPAPASPVKKVPAATNGIGKKGAGKKGKGAGSTDDAGSSGVSPGVLQERVGQDEKGTAEEDDDEEEIPIAKPKKKRALGKKVIMEDDMQDAPVFVAEVKRMVRG